MVVTIENGWEERKMEVTLENALTKMKELSKEEDADWRHIEADAILLTVLRQLGYNELCEAFEDLPKYYI